MSSLIRDFMKEQNCRLSIDNKWLFYDNTIHEWVVMEHKYGKRNNDVLYQGIYLSKALDTLSEVPA